MRYLVNSANFDAIERDFDRERVDEGRFGNPGEELHNKVVVSYGSHLTPRLLMYQMIGLNTYRSVNTSLESARNQLEKASTRDWVVFAVLRFSILNVDRAAPVSPTLRNEFGLKR